jgi:hypothetical protein
MSLPLNGPIVISIPNGPTPNKVFKCVASFRGSASVLAEASESYVLTGDPEDDADAIAAARNDALDAVIAALRSHSLGDLTLLPLLITTGGALPYKWI